jgi:hypothetical protein
MNRKWPWWLTILFATLCYLGLQYGLPAAAGHIPQLTPLAQLSPRFAPIITIALLLLGAKQLYDGVELPTENEDPKNKNEHSDNASH